MALFATFKFDPLQNIHTIFWLFVAVSSLVAVVVRNQRERAGQSWPIVGGTVESAQMTMVDGQARAEVAYSYSVNGEYFSGVFFRVPRTTGKGEELLAHFPKESHVLVHYKPGSPEISVLDLNEVKAKLALPA
jgi:hypothetical protein